jgi:hypothetical protein
MKASDLIIQLKSLIDRYGDLDLIYSSDDEGNNFDKVYNCPTPGYYKDHEFNSNDELEEEINSFCIN